MGWTGIPDFNGGVKEKIEEVTRGFENSDVLKSQMVNSTIYSAIRNNDTGEVWCMITLTAMDRGEFLYKSMDDCSGPYEYDCPLSILDLLTDTDSEYSLKWREKVRRVAEIKSRKVKRGDVIKLSHPIEFQGGGSFDTFVYREWYSFDAVAPTGTSCRVRLPKNWKTRYDWELGEPPSLAERASAIQERLTEIGREMSLEEITATLEGQAA